MGGEGKFKETVRAKARTVSDNGAKIAAKLPMYSLLAGPLSVERVTVPIPDLPLSLHGTTLVQLSDFHFDGLRLAPALLTEAITLNNAIAPDLVVLTGDFVTRATDSADALVSYLQHLHSRHGVYAVLGNHDSIDDRQRDHLVQSLKQAHINVLWNAIAYPLGPALPLIGLADLWSGHCDPATVMVSLDPATPRIVLAHNPDTASLMRHLRVDLQLSGHTHGGQIYVPGLGPVPALLKQARPLVPSWLAAHIPYMRDRCDTVTQHWKWAMGLHRLGQNYLYVNRGLGTYWPGRFCCPPELTVLTLVTV